MSTHGADMSGGVGDVDIRLRADISSRRPALLCFATAIVWLLIGSVLGDLASFKLHMPDLLVQQSWLTFGRVRPAHLNTMIYGWASLAMLGVAIWMIPRLVHQQLRWPLLATIGIILWNIGVVIGVVGIMAGVTDGLEWLEMHRYVADP